MRLIAKNKLEKLKRKNKGNFFNIDVHRTMILFEFKENGEATVVWTGTHEEYGTVFKNNKNTIKKWLKANDWI